MGGNFFLFFLFLFFLGGQCVGNRYFATFIIYNVEEMAISSEKMRITSEEMRITSE